MVEKQVEEERQAKVVEESEEVKKRKTNLRYQTLLYWYESSCTTCLAAWATSLGWKRKASQLTSSPKVLLVPMGVACLSFLAMQKLNYYNNPLEKHIAWLGF